MAKKSKTNARKRKQAQAAQAQAQGVSRRDVLRWSGFGALGVLAAGGAVFAGRSMYDTYVAEHDLTRIGKGKPAVVQVHDPSCATCTELQRETRKAMKQFEECDLVYLVADLTQPEGQVFASRHGVGRVTLVLLDADGEVTQVLPGMRQRAELRTVLKAHFDQHGTSGDALS